MTNRKVQVWLPIWFAVMMIVGMAIGYKLKENTSGSGLFSSAKKSPVQEVIDLINRKYVDDIGTDTIADKVLDNLLNELDPHSVYIPAAQLNAANEDIRGNFEGIGIEFQMIKDTLHVLNVIERGPSEQAGLAVGDKLIAVNDTSKIAGVKIQADDIRKLLRGPGGSTVKVTLLRNAAIKQFTITRGTIPLPSVDAAYMITPTTGFIHINKFAESTYVEFMIALEKLLKLGMKEMILDLRGNGGGLLAKAVDIADEFLTDNKMIVYTKGENVPTYEYRCKRDGLFETGKLSVLIDESSASASEVLAGALQDWDRATIIGRRSFGKGLVQEQFTLSNGGGLRLTVARYYSPLGRNIQKPYAKGEKAYQEEVYQRYNNGELMHGDTSKQKGQAFKTQKGKTVYGGGGITPDIFVALDTTEIEPSIRKLYTTSTLSNFAYLWYIDNKTALNAYKNAAVFNQNYTVTDNVLMQLKNYAAKDSIQLNNLNAPAESKLKQRIKQLLARQIWRVQGYYEIINTIDPVVQAALKQSR